MLDELNLNERVRTLTGVSIVEQIRLRPGRHIVYNIEVKGEHAYHVGAGGVLVHNAQKCSETLVRYGSKAEADQIRSTGTLQQRPGHRGPKRLGVDDKIRQA
ncbi:hypothetical protein [Polystyrenella longa]|uniref:hypothetical protein n=1 Tax=Polystyrenella longa TaxID=2528007 RepID=UPI0011A28782